MGTTLSRLGGAVIPLARGLAGVAGRSRCRPDRQLIVFFSAVNLRKFSCRQDLTSHQTLDRRVTLKS